MHTEGKWQRMKFTMWVLKDWLEDYELLVSVKEGNHILKSTRVITEKTVPYSDGPYLILCRAKDYIPSVESGILCMNRHDFLLVRTNDLEEVYNAVNEAMDFYHDWEFQAYQLIERMCALPELISHTAKLFSNPVVIADSGNLNLAGSLTDEQYTDEKALFESIYQDNFLDVSIQTQINDCLLGTENVDYPFFKSVDVFPYPVLIKNLRGDGRLIGRFMMWESQRPISQGQKILLDYAGEIIEKWHLHSHGQNTLKPKSIIFQELLEGEDLPDTLAHSYMQAMGWKNEEQKYLLKMLSAPQSSSGVQYLFNLFTHKFPQAHVFEYGQTIIMIISQKAWEDVQFQKQLQTYMKQLSLYAGKSYPFHTIRSIRECHHQAEIAARYGKQEKRAVSGCEDYIQAYISEQVKKHITVDISHQSLKTLREYDGRHGTDYYATLYVYLWEERNQTKTARKLNIHRNTLIKKNQPDYGTY